MMTVAKMQPPPVEAPYYPSEHKLKGSVLSETLSALAVPCTDNGEPCSIPVQVGIFFDGTNNNMERDKNGERVSLDGSQTSTVSIPPEAAYHSNVARLFEAFPEDRIRQGIYGFYMPGVGTRFEQIGEQTESSSGKAFAKGGHARIIFGLIQVLNALHDTATKKMLYDKSEAGKHATDYVQKIGTTKPGSSQRGPNNRITHGELFEPHIAKVEAALKAHPKPSIPSLTISVFGFSRGGAEAVAFCHLLNKLLQAGSLAGVPTRISFLGVFDIVATVGGSRSMASTLPLPGAIFDGMWDWANCITEPLPGCVNKGLHLIAAHEMRMNFPVTRQRGNIVEHLYPGCHSDIGGGYAPRDQGKSRNGQASMLSQIPLCHMYTAAREAGVPLQSYSEMTERTKVDFEVDADLASAWTAYIEELGNDNGGNLKAHLELFYRWLAERLVNLEQTEAFKASCAQDQEDVRSANVLLQGDLQALRYRQHPPQQVGSDEDQTPAFGQDMRYKMNQWHRLRANSKTPLNDWERLALAIFNKPEPLPPDVARFFNDYMHDSFASFYMRGEVTEFEKRGRTAKVLKATNPNKLSPYDKKIYDKAKQVEDAQRKSTSGEPLSPEEQALVKEAESGTPYPLMTDADSDDMLSWGDDVAVSTQSATRREGGGYILRRGYYPESGFFSRGSVDEEELMAPPSAKNPPKVVTYKWSNNLREDIAAAAKESAGEKNPTETKQAAELHA